MLETAMRPVATVDGVDDAGVCSTSSSSSSSLNAPVAVVKATGDVSCTSLAPAMQAYQTLGCQTPAATGFGSTAFYGQSSSPYSTLSTGSYTDGQ